MLISFTHHSVNFSGYSSLVLDSTGTNLFASCTDDNIYMFNVVGLKRDPGKRLIIYLNSNDLQAVMMT